MVPRNQYQPGCSNYLFDSACTLSKSAFAAAATATSALDSTGTIFSTGLAQAAGYFSQGFAIGVTGANAGVRRTIRLHSGGGTLKALSAWPAAVAIGDTFTVYPGCDKLQATCSGKFSNLVNFRGAPYVPAPETIT